MQIHYLEIVSTEVDATCQIYEKSHGIAFSKGDPLLGHARTAKRAHGGMIGVRAPMHEAEVPTIRVYILVKDINEALDHAVDSGAEVIHPALEIPSLGTFAIYQLGGNHHGFWQV